MQKNFHYYLDPGHGWVKVPMLLLCELEIHANITSCSYMRRLDAFLEEDLDVTTFFEAYKAKYGVDPVLIRHYANKQSKIRNYNGYRTPDPVLIKYNVEDLKKLKKQRKERR